MASKHYVSNALLLEHVKVWLSDLKQAKEEGRPRAQMSDTLANAIILIVDRMSKQGKFARYSFIEDMRGSAILQVVKYLPSFKPEKSENVFSYISAIVNNAYIHCLNEERTVAYRKLKLIERNEASSPSRKGKTEIQREQAEKIASYEAMLASRREKVRLEPNRTKKRGLSSEKLAGA